MTDRQMLDTLLRGADPVPNPADPPSGAWLADTALLEIERRSATMLADERRIDSRLAPPPRRRPIVVAVAAFVVVLAVVGLSLFLVNRPENDVVEPSTTTTTVVPTSTTAAPPTTPAPTTAPPTTVVTTTAAPALGASFRIGGLEPGTYHAAEFDAQFLIDIPDGWRGERADAMEIRISSQDRPAEFTDELAHWSIVFTAYRSGDTVENIAGDILAEAGTSEIITQGNAVLAGQGSAVIGDDPAPWVEMDNNFEDSDNRIFSIYVDLEDGDPTSYFNQTGTQASDFGFLGLDALYRNRFYVVGAPGGAFIVIIQAPQAEWDAFLPIAEAVIQSISFQQ